jgi:hypothetical protein
MRTRIVIVAIHQVGIDHINNILKLFSKSKTKIKIKTNTQIVYREWFLTSFFYMYFSVLAQCLEALKTTTNISNRSLGTLYGIFKLIKTHHSSKVFKNSYNQKN